MVPKIENELIMVYLLFVERYVKISTLDKYINKSIRTYYRYLYELKKSFSLMGVRYGEHNDAKVFYFKYSFYEGLLPRKIKYDDPFNKLEFGKVEKEKELFDFDLVRNFYIDSSEYVNQERLDFLEEKEKEWTNIQNAIVVNQVFQYITFKEKTIKNRLYRLSTLLILNIKDYNLDVYNFVAKNDYDSLEEAIKEATLMYKIKDPLDLYHSFGGLSKRTYQRDKKVLLKILQRFVRDYVDFDE